MSGSAPGRNTDEVGHYVRRPPASRPVPLRRIVRILRRPIRLRVRLEPFDMMSASLPLDLASLTKSQWDAAWATDHSWVMSEVYRAHASAVRQRATQICGVDLAHDVTHEVLMRVWRNPDGFDPSRGALRTYLLMLASGIAIDHVRTEARRRGRERRVELARPGVSHDDVTVVEPLLEKETAVHIHRALSTIAPAQRQAIEAVYLDGRTYAETATCTGVAPGTVKSRVRLGLDRLRPAVAGLNAKTVQPRDETVSQQRQGAA